MDKVALPVLNMTVTLAALYLFKVYGGLSWWWSRFYREHAEEIGKSANFHANADQIHIALIVLLALNLASGIVLWRCKVASPRMSIAASMVGAAALVICLVVNF
jgi:hypothetical protein